MSINNRDRHEWAHHPVTQEFLNSLKETRQERQDLWGRGGYTADSRDGTLQLNAEAIGAVGVITSLVDLIEELKALDTGLDDVERVTS